MTAIVYKDWLIVSPQESIRPYSMQCSGRVCGSGRDFFALSSEAAVSAPLLNNLSLEKLESLKKVTHTAQHDMVAVDQLQKKGRLQEVLERLNEIFKAVSDATNGLLRIRLKTHSQFEN